ncbi:MAG: DUF192 domain-containing protein [Candidatus Paceibacterota bacterium]|jgi:hypothetical protein
MDRKMIIGAIIILILIALAGAAYYYKQAPKVCFNNNCFSVEIALSPEEITTGLMNRKSLEENRGMLFIFKQEGQHSFWMKNTLIPLDIIWMDKDKKVVHIAENVQPCKEECNSISPEVSAKYVLEINGGLCSELNITAGAEADFVF